MTSSSPEPNSPPPREQDWLARTRYLFYGTAASFVELLQDPQKRAEDLGKLDWDINKLLEDLVAKGEMTEKEALRYVEEAQKGTTTSSPSTPGPEAAPPPTAETATEPAPEPPSSENRVSPEDISALMDLTREIENLRRDLEQKRTESN
ncbi:MAG: DUF3597 domain-containing protein [Synechococcaceae cyanobacterium SM2_3_1]|nr:DUF3597 domain-containing protein [Synechococcaceae cyanobacterium SM2_3_1]